MSAALPKERLRQIKRMMAKYDKKFDEDCAVDAAWVVAALEDASRTLAALPHGGHSTALTQPQREIVREFVEAYGYNDALNRAPVPIAAKISAMDDIFNWLRFIPQTRIRRIVAARSITHGISGNPMSWNRIAKDLRAHHQAVQNWHAQGIGNIVVALNIIERGFTVPSRDFVIPRD